MNILVTGGAGFIGSAVCLHLIAGSDAVVLNIDKLTYAANPQSLAAISGHSRYRFLNADICDRRAMTQAMEAFQPDAILHLAAESHVDRSIDGSAAFVEANVMGTYVLLEAARAYWTGMPEPRKSSFRFVHISTDEVYGSLGAAGLFTEATAYDPSSPYSATKAASDHLVMAWHRTYGFPALLSNCSNNYGPRQFPEKLIPLMILNGRRGRDLPIYGDGKNIRDWLYVDDHARALLLILQHGRLGEKYNVGGRNEQSNLAVVEQICDILDRIDPVSAPRRRLIKYVADRPGHDRRYAIDAKKLETELGWRAHETFATGLEKTVRWYIDNEAWCRSAEAGGYAGQRLGLDARIAKI